MVIITGGGSGIGRALALTLASRDIKVLIIGRRLELLKETSSYSTSIDYLVADVATDEGREKVLQHVKSVSHISALVNNAGTLNPLVSLKDLKIEDWHYALNTNLDAALFLPQKLYEKLRGGRVLTIGSGAAYFAIKGWAAYCISKAASAMLTQCWQKESSDIAFAQVMPGIIDTDMQNIARSGVNMDTSQAEFYQKLYQTKRLISADAVAHFLVWLLLAVDATAYSAKEWDIYDTTHHKYWLKPPFMIPHWE